jgi:hypothetical protein
MEYINFPTRVWIYYGFIVFGCCSAYGIKLIYLGITNQIIDESGMDKAPRWMFLAGGFLIQIPLVAYIVYLFHQGYFQK